MFLLLLLLNTGLWAGSAPPAAGALPAGNDTLSSPGLRIGLDLSGFARNYLEPETMTWELAAAMEFRRNWFAALEGGWLDIDIKKPSHNYKAKGYFIRAGVDYNFIDRPKMRNQGVAYGLIRYGFGITRHEAYGITIANPYWGEFEANVPGENAAAHWLETGGGIMARMFWNIHIGWSLRVRFLVYKSSTPGMEPYSLGGFGKNEDKPAVMVHYYIYYKF